MARARFDSAARSRLFELKRSRTRARLLDFYWGGSNGLLCACFERLGDVCHPGLFLQQPKNRCEGGARISKESCSTAKVGTLECRLTLGHLFADGGEAGTTYYHTACSQHRVLDTCAVVCSHAHVCVHLHI